MSSQRTVCLFLILAWFAGPLRCQEYRIASMPKKENKWGYMTLEGDFVVPPLSGLGLPCSVDGVGLITESGFPNSPCSMFDRQGGEILPPVELRLMIDQKDREVSGISGGMLRQVVKGTWGAINTKGILTVPMLYDELTDFDDGYALGKRDKVYYVVDAHGHEQPIERNSEITGIMHFSEGLAPVRIKRKGYGFADTSGKIVIEPKFATVGFFSAGYAWAMVHPARYGYIDRKGDWIGDPIFNMVNDFDRASGLAMVRIKATDLTWSFADTTGKVTTFSVAEEYQRFSEGLAPALLRGRWGYLNTEGRWAIYPAFEEVAPFRNGYAPAKFESYWGIINTSGKWILEPVYKQLGEVVRIGEAN